MPCHSMWTHSKHFFAKLLFLTCCFHRFSLYGFPSSSCFTASRKKILCLFLDDSLQSFPIKPAVPTKDVSFAECLPCFPSNGLPPSSCRGISTLQKDSTNISSAFFQAFFKNLPLNLETKQIVMPQKFHALLQLWPSSRSEPSPSPMVDGCISHGCSAQAV